MSSRMEQIIDEIQDYIEGCKYKPFSSTEILVNREELMELIDELRTKTPEEIKRYQKIISNNLIGGSETTGVQIVFVTV